MMFPAICRSEEMRKAISKTEFVKFEVDGVAAQAWATDMLMARERETQ